MAAVVPDPILTPSGYGVGNPRQTFFRTNTSGGLANVPARHHSCEVLVFGFTGIATGDTWTTNIPNIVGVFTQTDTPTATESITGYLSTQATGVITFKGATASSVNLQLLLLVGHA